ncbi:MAG: CstA-like transporter-associated (seleno)protein [Methylococcaceae bacterium]
MLTKIKSFWKIVRHLSDDDAYDRYLQHFAEHHQTDANPPLSKAAFFKQWQDSKWNGIKRCC